MSFIQSLKPTKARPYQLKSPLDNKRNRLIERLNEQIERATNPAYAPTIPKRIKRDDGSVAVLQKPKRIKRWWFTLADGTVELVIKYGQKRLELADGKDAIILKSKEEVPATLVSIREAVVNREFDDILQKQASIVKKYTSNIDS